MNLEQDFNQQLLHLETRRHFFKRCSMGLGSVALASLMNGEATAATFNPTLPRPPQHAGKAKAVIYLFMAGGPSQLELFEDKPKLRELNGKPAPADFMKDKQFAFLKADALLLGSRRTFGQYGQSGAALSELFPHHQKIVDDVCFVRGMTTNVFNHGPAKIFINTGAPQPGRPSMGSWVSYGIGSESHNLPAFVVLQSGPRGPRAGATLWSSGFLPTTHQGVPFRGKGDPILNLSNPPGIDDKRQRQFFDVVRDLNQGHLNAVGDPEIATRIAAYEMAYRMQSSAPELMDLSG
ncbi:MAG: DUF1501 domain-containing protein, partial [Planctomycetota bacterium]|nr:DUF1501 domain-containing protein [Planctomycetota bacterium]